MWTNWIQISFEHNIMWTNRIQTNFVLVWTQFDPDKYDMNQLDLNQVCSVTLT